MLNIKNNFSMPEDESSSWFEVDVFVFKVSNHDEIVNQLRHLDVWG